MVPSSIHCGCVRTRGTHWLEWIFQQLRTMAINTNDDAYAWLNGGVEFEHRMLMFEWKMYEKMEMLPCMQMKEVEHIFLDFPSLSLFVSSFTSVFPVFVSRLMLDTSVTLTLPIIHLSISFLSISLFLFHLNLTLSFDLNRVCGSFRLAPVRSDYFSFTAVSLSMAFPTKTTPLHPCYKYSLVPIKYLWEQW